MVVGIKSVIYRDSQGGSTVSRNKTNVNGGEGYAR